MNEVLKITLSLSCSGAMLIVIFHMLRPLVKTRLSKRWQYYIWLVVVARLLIPFAPEINLMGTLFEQIGSGSAHAELAPPAPQADTSGQKEDSAQSGPPAGSGVTSRVSDGTGWGSVLLRYLWLLWPITALVLLIRKVTIYQCFVKYIRAGCVEVEEIALLERFGSFVAQSGVKAAVDLSINPLISSPLLIGFFRPRIVLPATELSDSDFQFTILHELTHFKRLDMFYKWLVQATICIHWFNPFVYLMGREVERACELACDEAVTRELDTAGRRAYGDTLMNAIGASGRYKDSVAAVMLCEGKELMGERLAEITGFHTKSKFVRAFSVVLSGAVCLGAVSVGAYSPPTLGAKPKTSGHLTLVTAEFTTEELTAEALTGIAVNTFSDEITVAQGGDALKIEYYAANSEEYVLESVRDHFPDSLYNFLIFRSNQRQIAPGDRSITITLPADFPVKYLTLANTTGNIYLNDCTAADINVETEMGGIELVGVTASENLRVCTGSSDALLSKTALPISDKGVIDFQTQTGMITFLPLDNPNNYRIEVDYGDEANVIINGMRCEKEETLEAYAVRDPDGSIHEPPEAIKRINQFIINEDGEPIIYFHSPKGTLRLLSE